MLLQTKRLVIQPLKPDDHNFILELLNTEGWLKFIGDRNVKNAEDASDYIHRILGNKNFSYHVFRLKENEIPVGIITFLKRDEYEFPDIGFAMLPSYEKRGYAYEATRAYLDEVLKDGAFNTILGITLKNNRSSIDLLEKLGLQFKEERVSGGDTVAIYKLQNT
jgi:ribosomal-protein-alanine N-acetyltransferase